MHSLTKRTSQLATALYKTAVRTAPLAIRHFSLNTPVERVSIHAHRKGPMWSAQARVPRLPIPTLEETAERYIDHITPLVSPEAVDQTRALINEFISPQGEGRRLQAELHRLDEESPTSWLEGWWDTMYLEIRDPLVINVNPFLMLREDKKRTSQVDRAAALVAGCTRVFKLIKDGELSPDFEKDVPLDMSQYLKLFGSARIPQYRRDKLPIYSDSRHIVVISKNKFFSVDVLDSAGVPFPESSIHAALKEIHQQTAPLNSKEEEKHFIGTLTSEERNRWASVRAALEGLDPANAASLEMIDRALFVLVLDDTAPHGLEEASRSMLHRDGTYRWFDKMQVLTYANGMAANLFEHSPFDGHTVLRLWSEVDLYTSGAVAAPASAAPERPRPRKLDFRLNDDIRRAITEAKANVGRLIDKTQTAVLDFTPFGKKYISSGLRASPDSFVQMAFQLAYYRLYGRVDSTYESANTKRFQAGRTETLRSVTRESKAFVETWTRRPAADTSAMSTTLHAALEAHGRRMELAKNGRGVDRHLFGLRNLAMHKQQRLPAQLYDIPAVFRDPSYTTLVTSVLSTSNVTSPVFRLFGFGAVVEHGLGIAYAIQDADMQINVTSYTGQAKKFADALGTALMDMKSFVEKNPLPEKPKKK